MPLPDGPLMASFSLAFLRVAFWNVGVLMIGCFLGRLATIPTRKTSLARLAVAVVDCFGSRLRGNDSFAKPNKLLNVFYGF